MAGFGISQGKGFHITFENGWTVSVQFGDGNYCQNRTNVMDDHTRWISQDGDTYYPSQRSPDAEIAAWDADGVWYDFSQDEFPETVAGWKQPHEVLEFLNLIANK